MAFEDDYDPRLMREFMSQMQASGKITEELNDEIKQSNTSFAKLRKEGLASAGQGLKDIASGSKDLATGLIGGKRGFDSLNPAIDLAANALTSMTSFIPVIGKAVEGGAKLVAEGSKLMLSQLQGQVDAFQSIGEVGGLTADGLTGLQRQFLASGLTLESYTKAVQNSSQTLARFRGLTGDGAEDFSIIVGKLTQSTDLGLRRIGLSADQMGESAEAFLSRQTRLGLSQGLSNQILAQSTTTYIKELDILSKVTGLNRKTIQDQQDQALNESRFASKLNSMKGTADEKNISSLQNFDSAVTGLSASVGRGMRDLSSFGAATTAEAKAIEAATGGQASKISQLVETGKIDEIEGTKRLVAAINANIEQIQFAGRTLGSESIFGDVAGLIRVANTQFGENGKILAKSTKAQQDQIKGTDSFTNSAVATQQALERAQRNLSALFFKAMPGATDVVDKFTGAMNEGIINATALFDPELAQKMNKEYFERTGNAVDLGLGEAMNKLDAKLSMDRMSGVQQVTSDDLISALTGMGIDTLKEGHAQDFARQHGLEATRKAYTGDRDRSVKEVFGLKGYRFDGSIDLPISEMLKLEAGDGIKSRPFQPNNNLELTGMIGKIKDTISNVIPGPNIENGITNTVSKAMLAGQRDLALGFTSTEAARRLELNKLNDNVMTGPKEKYTSTVANLDVEPQQAVDKEATEKLARTTDTYSELLKENNGKLDQVISHIAASNNIQNKILTSSYS